MAEALPEDGELMAKSEIFGLEHCARVKRPPKALQDQADHGAGAFTRPCPWSRNAGQIWF